jgi:hypothetical protein
LVFSFFIILVFTYSLSCKRVLTFTMFELLSSFINFTSIESCSFTFFPV